MTKSFVFLFSLIFSTYVFAERSYELPLEQWSDDDSNQVFAVLDEELNDAEHEEYREYEEVHFDEQGQIIETTRETYQQNRYEDNRNDDSYLAHTSHWNSPRNTRRSHRHRNHHRRRHHRRRPPVIIPPPIVVAPPLVSPICRSGPLGNGFYFCYFVDGLPRPVGNTCSCYLRNAYTGERIFFRGRVSTW